MILNYITQFFLWVALRILKHSNDSQLAGQTRTREILQPFTRNFQKSIVHDPAPYNSTMSSSAPNIPLEQAAQCGGTYHILSCGHGILTARLEPCACNCLKPSNNIAFACQDCAGAIRDTLNDQLTCAEKMRLDLAEKSGNDAQYQLYLSEYVTARVSAISTCQAVLNHIEGSRRASSPARVETISAFEFWQEQHPFITYNEYARQRPELFGLPAPSSGANSTMSAGLANGENLVNNTCSSNLSPSEPILRPRLFVPSKRPCTEPFTDDIPTSKHHKAKAPIILDKADQKRPAKHLRDQADEDPYFPSTSLNDGDIQIPPKRRSNYPAVNFSEPKFAPQPPTLVVLQLGKRLRDQDEEAAGSASKSHCMRMEGMTEPKFGQSTYEVLQEKREWSGEEMETRDGPSNRKIQKHF
ncbi:hypothetical protein AOQ84DRAFT_228124 [Glonium stellatum]|uniref:Uncharacterized protein n=1 Tax=Glonium stellatum TaxID=574774 RepID=A0A8E2JMN0_9PEZI|nr:hypothetical protein AOQ84DRAFT_228124 [Glonium stellatum]